MYIIRNKIFLIDIYNKIYINSEYIQNRTEKLTCKYAKNIYNKCMGLSILIIRY